MSALLTIDLMAPMATPVLLEKKSKSRDKYVVTVGTRRPTAE